jgi:hypothetical protein
MGFRVLGTSPSLELDLHLTRRASYLTRAPPGQMVKTQTPKKSLSPQKNSSKPSKKTFKTPYKTLNKNLKS